MKEIQIDLVKDMTLIHSYKSYIIPCIGDIIMINQYSLFEATGRLIGAERADKIVVIVK